MQCLKLHKYETSGCTPVNFRGDMQTLREHLEQKAKHYRQNAFFSPLINRPKSVWHAQNFISTTVETPYNNIVATGKIYFYKEVIPK